jgi:hypothetical protein
MSKGEWVRRAIEEALRRGVGKGGPVSDPLVQLASLGAPTSDIEQMLYEIESGRR